MISLLFSCFSGMVTFAVLHRRPIRGDTWLVSEFAAGSLIFLYYVLAQNHSLVTSFLFSACIVLSQILGIGIAAVCFRLSFLHPLNKYPGPLLARCTSLYMTYVVWKGKRHLLFLELHRKYGDFVRIGPNTVSINRHDTIAPIYNNANCWDRTEAYHMGGLPGAGLFFIESLQEHNERKHYWSQAFTTAELSKYRPTLERKTNDLLEAIQRDSKINDRVLDISLVMQYWAHDVAGLITFGDTWEYNFCRDGDHISLLKATDMETTMFEILGQAPSLSHLMWYLPTTDIFRVMDQISQKAIDLRRREGSQIPDIMGHLLGEHSEHGQTLQEDHLRQEGAFSILAGTNGVSSAIILTLYYLCLNRVVYNRLRKEIRDAFPSYDLSASLDAKVLFGLPYLSAVVNEGVRLGAPLGNFPRVVPKGGAVVSEQYLPEGYIVSVPAWAQQISEKNFYPDPETFLPERWMAEGLGPGSILNRNALMTFSHGPFGCIGKNLVYQELHLVLAKIILAFDFKFSDHFDSKAFFDGIENRRTTRFTVPLKLIFY